MIYCILSENKITLNYYTFDDKRLHWGFAVKIGISRSGDWLTLFSGVCRFAHAYLGGTKRKIWGVAGVAGASNFFTFNFIILNIFCEKLACLTSLLQIFWLFPKEDHQRLLVEPYKVVKSVNVLWFRPKFYYFFMKLG